MISRRIQISMRSRKQTGRPVAVTPGPLDRLNTAGAVSVDLDRLADACSNYKVIFGLIVSADNRLGRVCRIDDSDRKRTACRAVNRSCKRGRARMKPGDLSKVIR